MIVTGETGRWREGEQWFCPSATDHSGRPGQHGNPNHNPIYCNRREAAPADPGHEPGDCSVGDDEGADETDGEDDPFVRCDFVSTTGIFVFAADSYGVRVKRGNLHGR